jgi:hypothetical protein
VPVSAADPLDRVDQDGAVTNTGHHMGGVAQRGVFRPEDAVSDRRPNHPEYRSDPLSRLAHLMDCHIPTGVFVPETTESDIELFDRQPTESAG